MSIQITQLGYGDHQTWGGRTPYEEQENDFKERVAELKQGHAEAMIKDFMASDLQDVLDKMNDDQAEIFAKQVMLVVFQAENDYQEFWKAFAKVTEERAETDIFKQEDKSSRH